MFTYEDRSTALIGAPHLLTVIFVILKLTKLIDWKWVWVLSPTWIPVALLILMIVILEILVRFSDN